MSLLWGYSHEQSYFSFISLSSKILIHLNALISFWSNVFTLLLGSIPDVKPRLFIDQPVTRLKSVLSSIIDLILETLNYFLFSWMLVWYILSTCIYLCCFANHHHLQKWESIPLEYLLFFFSASTFLSSVLCTSASLIREIYWTFPSPVSHGNGNVYFKLFIAWFFIAILKMTILLMLYKENNSSMYSALLFGLLVLFSFHWHQWSHCIHIYSCQLSPVP